VCRNLQQRDESHFAHFIKSIPTYGGWDDHDYGKNDAEHDQPGKEIALAAWKDLWPNPYPDTVQFPGNYYSYSWGDADFFVLDCRWYRNSKTGTLFGTPQLEWLSEQLVASKATFKIVVSGSDVMADSMGDDVRRIGKVVAANGISGVLFNSGDIHRNEFKVQELEGWPYPVMQITSSGIGRVWRRPYAIVNVDTSLPDPEVVAQFYSADSSDAYTSWSNDANLRCSDVQGNNDKESFCTERIRLSDLTP
jgi:alkaline phosphatase D